MKDRARTLFLQTGWDVGEDLLAVARKPEELSGDILKSAKILYRVMMKMVTKKYETKAKKMMVLIMVMRTTEQTKTKIHKCFWNVGMWICVFCGFDYV